MHCIVLRNIKHFIKGTKELQKQTNTQLLLFQKLIVPLLILCCGRSISLADELAKIVDKMDEDERKIHAGIANGHYELTDRKAKKAEDTSDDEYGKLLFDV